MLASCVKEAIRATAGFGAMAHSALRRSSRAASLRSRHAAFFSRSLDPIDIQRHAPRAGREGGHTLRSMSTHVPM